ncbi:MAG: PTH1 family peptidyl-tRNA hydrolase [Flavobacteriaceae bacterium]|jgi:PTH1 family peptidyl-tRNA hydrolase
MLFLFLQNIHLSMIAFLRKLFGYPIKQKNAEEGNLQEKEKTGTIKSSPPSREINMKKFLIVGLGNIGPKYENTRHNIGFRIVDVFAEKESLTFETVKLGDKTTYKLKGRTFVFIKPSTFMNLSGKSVKYWLEKEKIPLENLLVLTDDLNLAFGTFRIKKKGSDGGHNGLKDIQHTLNTTQYNRFRFGISDAFSEGRQVDYVLGEWTEEEEKNLSLRVDKAIDAIKSFGLAGMANTMNSFNGK